jgi:hypothetical protein
MTSNEDERVYWLIAGPPPIQDRFEGIRQIGSPAMARFRFLCSPSRAPGPIHGYAITHHIHSLSDALRVEEGSLCPSLHRMEEAGWIRARIA